MTKVGRERMDKKLSAENGANMRSTDCSVLIHTTLPSYQSYQKARHYLRTLRGRKAVAAKQQDAKAPEKNKVRLQD